MSAKKEGVLPKKRANKLLYPPVRAYRSVWAAERMRLPKITGRNAQLAIAEEIDMYVRSYRETDGVVRDKEVLRTLAALRLAFFSIKAWKGCRE